MILAASSLDRFLARVPVRRGGPPWDGRRTPAPDSQEEALRSRAFFLVVKGYNSEFPSFEAKLPNKRIPEKCLILAIDSD